MPKTPLSPIEHVDIALGDRSYRIAIGGGLLDDTDSFAQLPAASTALQSKWAPATVYELRSV